VMPHIASHFLKAEVRHFDYDHEDAALEWLKRDVRVAQPVA